MRRARSARSTRSRDVARPELVRALEAVVEKPESDKWLDLARMLRPPPRQSRSEEEDFGRDAELLRVASFASAAEAYRLDSTSPEPAAFVAAMLVDLGMGEAAPAVLADAVKAQKDPRIVGLALAITMQAMGRALEAEEPDGVRRTFRAAAPILAAADALKKAQPSPARVYGMMGEIEIREGRLDEARKLLTASVEREKSGSVLLSLARLDWHGGHVKSAESSPQGGARRRRRREGSRAPRRGPPPPERHHARGRRPERRPQAARRRSAISRRPAAPPRATIARASSGSSRARSIASAPARAR